MWHGRWAALAASALAEARVLDQELVRLREQRDELAAQGEAQPHELGVILEELVAVERRIHELGG